MNLPLARRRQVWWPTWAGWGCLFLVAASATALWWFRAERFFSMTEREPADVLVVESWIGFEGLAAAKEEFQAGGYKWVVSAGGLSDNPWDRVRWDLAREAGDEFGRLGIPRDRIIVASHQDTESQRTFATAAAAWRALAVAGVKPRGINVFTIGPHARRSRLIFAKVFQPEVPVGVVSWSAPKYRHEPWWRSSERAEDLIKETAGWSYEVLLNSGRLSNSAAESSAANH